MLQTFYKDIYLYSANNPICAPLAQDPAYHPKRNKQDFSDIAIIAYGDQSTQISLLPVLNQLKTIHPRSHITLYSDSFGKELCEGFFFVDKVEHIPFEDWIVSAEKPQDILRTAWQYIKSARRHKVVFNFSHHHYAACLAYRMSPKNSFGITLNRMGDVILRGNRWAEYYYKVFCNSEKYPHICDQNILKKRYVLQLMLGLGSGEMKVGRYIALPVPADNYNSFSIGVVLAATQDHYKLPQDKLLELIKGIKQEFDATICLYAQKEFLAVETIDAISKLGYVLVLDPASGFKNAMAHLIRCRVVVSDHNPLIHALAQAAVPTMVLCAGYSKGPEYPGIHTTIRKQVPCGPCYQNYCSLKYCISAIDIKDVLRVLQWQMKAVSSDAPLDVNDPILAGVSPATEVKYSNTKLPDYLNNYIDIRFDETQVVDFVLKCAFVCLWDHLNSLLLREKRVFALTDMFEWVVYGQEYNPAKVAVEIKKTLDFVGSLHQRISLLMIRLEKFVPRLPFYKLQLDVENLWSSLVEFDATLPSIFQALMDPFARHIDPEENTVESIRNWIYNKKILLKLLEYYKGLLLDILKIYKDGSE